jgi:hypothetical protein
MGIEEQLSPYVKLEHGKPVIRQDQLPPLRQLIREEYRVVRVHHHEEEFMPILFPLEEAALTAYRDDRTVGNHDVKVALKELRDRLPDLPAGALAAEMYRRLHLTAALNPGRFSDAEIKACIDRILDSIKLHGGRQGYLLFLDQMLDRS